MFPEILKGFWRMAAYNQKESLNPVSKIYSQFEPRARRLLDLAGSDSFRIWKLMEMDDIPTWSRNRTALLADEGGSCLLSF
jgi:salicylate hydroxylase